MRLFIYCFYFTVLLATLAPAVLELDVCCDLISDTIMLEHVT